MKVVLQAFFENDGRVTELFYGIDETDIYVLIEYKGVNIPLRFFGMRYFWPINNPLGVAVAIDKHVAYELMIAHGVAAPSTAVYNSHTSLDGEVKDFGSVVVKPASRSHADGITTDITSADDLKTAISYAKDFDNKVLVQEQVYGDDFRLLFVNYELAGALLRHKPFVVGNGSLTISQLIDKENARRIAMVKEDSKKSPLTAWRAEVCSLISIKEIVRKHGESFMYRTPASGEKAVLLGTANIGLGGVSEDVTSLVHPDIVSACSSFLRSVRLELAGVDIMSQDITAPLGANKTFVLEVNSEPGLLPHARPNLGKSQDVGKIVADALALCFKK